MWSLILTKSLQIIQKLIQPYDMKFAGASPSVSEMKIFKNIIPISFLDLRALPTNTSLQMYVTSLVI